MALLIMIEGGACFVATVEGSVWEHHKESGHTTNPVAWEACGRDDENKRLAEENYRLRLTLQTMQRLSIQALTDGQR